MKSSIISFFLLASSLFADEGMWPLNMVPKAEIREMHGIEITENWLDHVQKACLRMSTGGSGSFVSAQGLVLTNHHVGAEAIYNLSTQEKDLLKEGFYAKTREEERACPNMYVDQLIAIQDVTDQITLKLSPLLTPVEREKERKILIAQILAQAKEETGLQPEMVTLYRGARYHLYLYKRYNDVRLVMCPEQSIASFGGDIENFEFPRHALDMCFFRVYHEGKPLQTDHYFKWSIAGPQEEETLFVLGHPGRTERILTASHLAFLRDYEIPLILNMIVEKIEILEAFSAQNEERARMASHLIHRYQNAYKVYNAFNEGLKHSSLIQRKSQAEELLLKTLSSDETAIWSFLGMTLEEAKAFYPEYFVLERMGGAHFCKLFTWARLLVRAADEQRKPNEERLREYQESELPALEMDLLGAQPIYPEMEVVLLDASLESLKALLEDEHPLQEFLMTQDAETLINESQLSDLDYRRKLLEDPAALAMSQDPLILLARAIDPYARKIREQYEEEFFGPQKESYAQMTHILFKQKGESLYPDATFTLRLSLGKMEGYEEGGEWLSPLTDIAGVYAKATSHAGEPFYSLPSSWRGKEEILKGSTPFNFVSTHDIIGGNSGSPMINAKGEVVGLIFDGNRHSFLWDFEFDQTLGRAISVHSAGILESLQKVYDAQRLVEELILMDPL